MRNSRFLTLRLLIPALCFGITQSSVASESLSNATQWTFGGHSKYQYVYTKVPQDSVLHSTSGDNLQDHNLEVRLKIAARRDRLGFEAHAQFITVHSDTLSDFRNVPGLLFPGRDLINDDRRWFDLTHEFHNQGKNATLVS